MSEKPILFSGAMVRAIMEDRKWKTRRVIKPQPTYICHDWQVAAEPGDEVIYRGWPHKLTESRGRNKAAAGELTPIRRRCPYGQPGDRLWVRETWRQETFPASGSPPLMHYRADDTAEHRAWSIARMWRPSIHMPRWASRLTLEIVGVKVERLQDIDNVDCCMELGAPLAWDGEGEEPYQRNMRGAFANLWDELNAKRGYAWASNPWVWCISFKRIDP